jgi:hypothetical protein
VRVTFAVDAGGVERFPERLLQRDERFARVACQHERMSRAPAGEAFDAIERDARGRQCDCRCDALRVLDDIGGHAIERAEVMQCDVQAIGGNRPRLQRVFDANLCGKGVERVDGGFVGMEGEEERRIWAQWCINTHIAHDCPMA